MSVSNQQYDPIGSNGTGISFCIVSSNGGPPEIHISKSAHSGSIRPVYVFAHLDPSNLSSEIVKIGELRVEGIHEYLYVVGHEQGHSYYFTEPDTANGGGIPIQQYAAPYVNDTDGDGISDAWEDAHGLDKFEKDSTGAYGDRIISTPNGPVVDTAGDSQLIADVYALSLLKAKKVEAVKYDWADDGLNYSGVNPNDLFPWAYVGGGNFADPPANALSGPIVN